MSEVGSEPDPRLPTPPEGRFFTSGLSFFYTLTTLASAVWIILVGGALPAVGDTRLGILGYACGTLLGAVLVLLSVAVPAFRHGIDSIVLGKAALGIRGSALVVLGMVVSALGWAGIALAMVARGIGQLLVQAGQLPLSEALVTPIALMLVPVVLLMVRHGLPAIRRLNDLAGPGFILLAIVSLGLLLARVDPAALFSVNVPPEQALTTDRVKSFAYGLEFGMAISVAWWPYLGGLYRHLRHRRHVVWPLMLGGSLVGNVFSAAVAALATVHLGSADPVVWVLALAGPVVGTVIVCLLLLLSLPAICLMVYFVASALREAGPLPGLDWNRAVALSCLPLVLVALDTAWTLDHVVTIANLGGLVFFSVCGICLVDYWVLRRGVLAVESLFIDDARSACWYHGGFNWIAVLTVAAGSAGYLHLFDPLTLATPDVFRYAGAALPVVAGSALLYWGLMRLAAVFSPVHRCGAGRPDS